MSVSVFASVSDRIDRMSDEGALCLLTNLQRSGIPPYDIHVHTSAYNVQGYDIDVTVRVSPDNEKARRAYRALGVEKVREIARTILHHPAFGESVLIAMMDGYKVIIIVEKSATLYSKPMNHHQFLN